VFAACGIRYLLSSSSKKSKHMEVRANHVAVRNLGGSHKGKATYLRKSVRAVVVYFIYVLFEILFRNGLISYL
jgi:hypothetical protein